LTSKIAGEKTSKVNQDFNEFVLYRLLPVFWFKSKLLIDILLSVVYAENV